MAITTTPLLLITKDPSHPLAHLALRYARAVLKQTEAIANNTSEHHSSQNTEASTVDASSDSYENNSQPLNLFFYADAAHIANRLRWQSAEQVNLTHEWQTLAKQYGISLPVCVSTALSRGISDNDNSSRHQLQGDNLAHGFELVGLSELAVMMQSDCRLILF